MEVKVGKVTLGGLNPIAVQTMWDKPLYRITDATVRRFKLLEELGCSILRLALPGEKDLYTFQKIRKITDVALVADIHFDYSLALKAMPWVDKIRINPGNIGASWKVREVFKAAKDYGVAIRIGVNAGSLPVELRKTEDTALAMLRAAEKELSLIKEIDFTQLIFSLKSSDIEITQRANILFAEKYNFPLHIGLTEAGPIVPGLIKSTLALGPLLDRRIGSTIRISLSAKPEYEIIAARQLLKSKGLSEKTPTIISCPTCARAGFKVMEFLKQHELDLYKIKKNITIAVMGCTVNGPEEAKHADIGITGAGNSVIIFKKGEILQKVKPENAGKVFLELLESL